MFEQGAAFAIVGTMVALFVRDRLRYDLVAMLALFAAVMVGIVFAAKAFSGFSDDVVVIVAAALLVSAAVARSGVVEFACDRSVRTSSRCGGQGDELGEDDDAVSNV